MAEQDDWWSQDQEAPTGEAFLKTLDPARAAQVKALAEGRMELPKGQGLRSPTGQQLLADVAQYDPAFDVANAGARIQARKAFTSGAQGKNITSFNTAIGHLGALAKATEELNNSSFTPWNSLANGFQTMTGDPAVTNFNTAKQAVVDELIRAFKGTGGNVHEAEQWEATINSSRSPAQLRGAIKQAADLLRSRIGAMQDSYNAAMGTTEQPLPMLNEHAQDALRRFESQDYLDQGYGAILSAEHGGGSPPPPAGPQGGPPPDKPVGPPGGPSPWDNPTGDSHALPTGGERTFFTDEDRRFAAEADQLMRTPGTTRADFNELAMRYKRAPFGADLDKALQYRAQHPKAAISVNPYASGREEQTVLQKIAASPVGAFGVGAADAATFGTMNKIAAGVDAIGGRLSGDNRQLGEIYDQNLLGNNLKTDVVQAAHPLATLAGETTGFIAGERALGALGRGVAAVAPGAAALTGRLIRPGAQALARDAAYGAAYGAGSSDTLGEVPGNALSGAALGAAGGALGRGLARGGAAILQPAVAPAVRRLTDAGVTLTPGQIMGASDGFVGKAVKGIEDRLTGFSGAGDAINKARREGVDSFNKAALDDVLEPIGQQADGIGHAGIADARAKVVGALDDAVGKMQAIPDAQLSADLAQVTSDAQALSQSHRDQFEGILSRDVEPYLRGRQQLGGSDIQSIQRGLDKKIANLRGQGSSPQDRDLADHLEGIRDAILDNAERTAPEAAQAFQAAKRSYALLARVENAAENTTDGVFTPKRFRMAVGRKGYGTTRSNLATGSAPFQQLATDASTILPSSIPDSGTAGREALSRALGMHGTAAALGGAGGYYEGGSSGALAGGLAGAALGAAAFSRPAISLANKVLVGNRGKAVTTLADVIRANAGLGGAVGTPLLLQKLPE